MKKLFVLLLCAAMMTVLVACGGGSNAPETLTEEYLKGEWKTTVGAEQMMGAAEDLSSLGIDASDISTTIDATYTFDGEGNVTINPDMDDVKALYEEMFEGTMYESYLDTMMDTLTSSMENQELTYTLDGNTVEIENDDTYDYKDGELVGQTTAIVLEK